MTRTSKPLLCILFTFVLVNCTGPRHPYTPNVHNVSRAMYGAAAGVGAGITIGAISGMSGAGAIVGGALGSAIGYHWGSQMSRNAYIFRAGVQQINYGNNIAIILPSDGFFELDTPNFTKVGLGMMYEIFKLVKARSNHGKKDIVIVGHTDDIGSWRWNQDLSHLQAQAVLSYLWAHGIDLRHLHLGGFGPDRDVASNFHPEGNAMNRRVEIYIPYGKIKHPKKPKRTIKGVG